MVFSPGQDQNIGGGWAGDSLGKTDSKRTGTGTYMLMLNNPPSARRLARRRIAPGGDLVADGRYQVSAQRSTGITFVDHGFQEYGSQMGGTITGSRGGVSRGLPRYRPRTVANPRQRDARDHVRGRHGPPRAPPAILRRAESPVRDARRVARGAPLPRLAGRRASSQNPSVDRR